MAIYKLLFGGGIGSTEEWGVLLKSDDPNNSGLGIPFDPDNTDYQKYLAWVAEGNTAEPADDE